MMVKVPLAAKPGQLLQMTTPHGTQIQCQACADGFLAAGGFGCGRICSHCMLECAAACVPLRSFASSCFAGKMHVVVLLRACSRFFIGSRTCLSECACLRLPHMYVSVCVCVCVSVCLCLCVCV